MNHLVPIHLFLALYQQEQADWGREEPKKEPPPQKVQLLAYRKAFTTQFKGYRVDHTWTVREKRNRCWTARTREWSCSTCVWERGPWRKTLEVRDTGTRRVRPIPNPKN